MYKQIKFLIVIVILSASAQWPVAKEWHTARSHAASSINVLVRNQSHTGHVAQDPAMVSQTIAH